MKTNIHLTIVAIIMALVSCTPKEDPQELLNNVCDQIRGKYICKSITFKGEPLDLNNDSIRSTDLIEELAQLPNCDMAIRDILRIFPAREYNSESSINIFVSAQVIDYDKVEQTYKIKEIGAALYLAFAYYVDQQGNISFITQNEEITDFTDESDFEITAINLQYFKGDRIESLENGILKALAYGSYYDYSTEKLVTGPVEYIYERTSYSLY